MCKVNIAAIGLNDGFEVLAKAIAEPSQRQKCEENKHHSKVQQPEEQPSPVHELSAGEYLEEVGEDESEDR